MELERVNGLAPEYAREQAWKGFWEKNLMAIGGEDKDYTGYTADEIAEEYGSSLYINLFIAFESNDENN